MCWVCAVLQAVVCAVLSGGTSAAAGRASGLVRCSLCCTALNSLAGWCCVFVCDVPCAALGRHDRWLGPDVISRPSATAQGASGFHSTWVAGGQLKVGHMQGMLRARRLGDQRACAVTAAQQVPVSSGVSGGRDTGALKDHAGLDCTIGWLVWGWRMNRLTCRQMAPPPAWQAGCLLTDAQDCRRLCHMLEQRALRSFLVLADWSSLHLQLQGQT